MPFNTLDQCESRIQSLTDANNDDVILTCPVISSCIREIELPRKASHPVTSFQWPWLIAGIGLSLPVICGIAAWQMLRRKRPLPTSSHIFDTESTLCSKINFQMSNPNQCLFKECSEPALPGFNRCLNHKNRSPCSVPNCPNQVYARYLCVRHGGKRVCAFENCNIYARGGQFCGKHGGIVNKRFCLVEGCKKQAHANQKCVRHGGGRFCKIDGCSYHSRSGGFCLKHQPSSPPKATQPESSESLDDEILDVIIKSKNKSNVLARPATVTVIDPFEMKILESLLGGK
ncbi:hypothetical protein THRCLA_05248 [Thraustotheca clavata]|uniref:Uncharacterized protein n=1 Tax=Thraustotheca clavata TaxID=74557 RepID=A0A1V9ZWH6_9STRA|nr:hypothetical protein THRCLA_05248 [Thraustotheca clavata]